jgi:membrane associated rhomboid family serine protease
MFFPFHDDNPTMRPPVVTVALVAVNLLGFLWVGMLPAARQQALYLERGFIPARIQQLTDPKPLVIKDQVLVQHPFFGPVAQERAVAQLPPNRNQIITSLFTSMFLHGSWMHIIFNMWFLWLFGNNVEDRLGGAVYLLFYLGGGLLASACHWAMDPSSVVPVVGASGAVAAILGAYAVTWPWARIHCFVLLIFIFWVIDVPAVLVLGVWFISQVLAARQELLVGMNGGVALWAHIGGFVAGAVLMPIVGNLIGAPPVKRPKKIIDDEGALGV